jgi:hypothetical protein
MRYERQKMIQKELDARIPRGLRGEPQNILRHIVNSQRLHGMNFEKSVEFAINFVRERYPNFTPIIFPPPAH